MAYSDIINADGYSLFELSRKLQDGLDRFEEAEARLLRKLNSWISNFPDEYVVLRSIKVYESSKKRTTKNCSFPIQKAATRVLEIWKQKVYRNVKTFRSRRRNQVLENWKRNFYARNFKLLRSRRVHPWFSFNPMKVQKLNC